MDGWCTHIIWKDFRSLYAENCLGRKTRITPAKRYSQYAAWLEGLDKEDAQRYWKEYLDGYSGLATLKDVGSDQAGPYMSASREFLLSRDQSGALQDLSARYGVTLYSLLQCAWGILLAKYNNSRDVVFGSVVSGRPAE